MAAGVGFRWVARNLNPRLGLIFLALSAYGAEHTVPLFLSSANLERQGFLRLINHADEAGTVQIVATDEAGEEFGPVYLTVAARATVHVNSTDVEEGNAQKGLPEGIGANGVGDWRLALETDLAIEPLTYVRTRDGFVTSVHDVIGPPAFSQTVWTFNPPRNQYQRSVLWVTNRDDAPVSVEIYPVDDHGWSYSPLMVDLDVGESRRVTVGDFEALTQRPPTGKLRLNVYSDRLLSVMNLMESPTGHLTNLSTHSLQGDYGVSNELVRSVRRLVPLFLAADRQGQEGFVRLYNPTADETSVEIVAVDDAGNRRGPVTLTLGAHTTRNFNSADLEAGDADKGLPEGIGSGEGDWWLEIKVNEPRVRVSTFARTDDGFLTSIHDRIPRVGLSHRAPFFNPASNTRQRSLLRLVNSNAAATTITIRGRDDRGVDSEEVELRLEAGVARTLDAAELEEGGEGLTGAFGDGAGKWQVTVDADQPIEALALLESPTGHLTNLSGSPAGRRFTKPQERHNVILRVIRVTPDWLRYEWTDGWTTAVPTKESAHVKYFEAAIWEEVGAVHLYEFDNDYNALFGYDAERYYGESADTRAIAYRERFLVSSVLLPDADRSPVLAEAFEGFADGIAARYPDSDHHLMYSGHGGPGGNLFAGQMQREDAGGFLRHWRESLGRDLGVVDMGGPCNKGALRDLETFCAHATYYIASDLTNGGFQMDEFTGQKYAETDAETQYPTLFKEDGDLEGVLKRRIDLRRKRYEYSRENMIENSVEQANYLYACDTAREFGPNVRAFIQSDHSVRSGDLWEYLTGNGAPANLREQFEGVIRYQADNRDFFEWEATANGLLCLECR